MDGIRICINTIYNLFTLNFNLFGYELNFLQITLFCFCMGLVIDLFWGIFK